MTLTEFLLARIAEDEADASEATPGPWWFGGFDLSHEPPWRRFYGVHAGNHPQVGILSADAPGAPEWVARIADQAHAARHNPARVLAECEAKRRIVALAIEAQRRMMDGPDLHKDGTFHTVSAWMRDVLCRLAAVYAEHPDYRSEWAP